VAVAELVDEIQVDYGRPLSDSQHSQVVLWIGEAEFLIRRHFGIADLTSLDRAAVSIAVRHAVVDLLKRPDAATMVQVSVDDASTTRRYEASSGVVRIRPEDWLMLAPDVGSGEASPGAWSFQPGFEADSAPWGWRS
jgi:hypothetical protein